MFSLILIFFRSDRFFWLACVVEPVFREVGNKFFCCSMRVDTFPGRNQGQESCCCQGSRPFNPFRCQGREVASRAQDRSGQLYAHGIYHLRFSSPLSLSIRSCTQFVYQSLRSVHLPELALSSSNVPTHPCLSRQNSRENQPLNFQADPIDIRACLASIPERR